MNFDQITKLYPAAYLTDTKPASNELYSWKYKNQWLNIMKSNISTREVTLLTLLLQKEKNNYTIPSNPWTQFLEYAGKEPKFSGKIRFLFFQVKVEQSSRSLWLNTLKNMFSSQILATFSISQNQYCLVEKVSSASYSSQEFIGVLQTIDADIGSCTKLFVGRNWINTNLIIYYNEEKKIFETNIDQVITTVFSLKDVALPYFAKSNLQKSNIILFYRKLIYQDKQLPDIIRTLYQNQGNISSTAKKLYIHRNTLLYHIDKVNTTLDLDLKKMDDLLLAYMSLF